jgi:hypothetical protein
MHTFIFICVTDWTKEAWRQSNDERRSFVEAARCLTAGLIQLPVLAASCGGWHQNAVIALALRANDERAVF